LQQHKLKDDDGQKIETQSLNKCVRLCDYRLLE